MSIFSKIIFKILKENSLNIIRKNKNSEIGKNFRLGNFSNISIHSSASLIISDKVNIKNNCSLFVGKDSKIILENNVFMNNYCSINAMEKIEIGENTLFGEAVKLYDHNHEYGNNPEFKIEHQKFKTASIKIGKNCWLGSNVIVLKGVTIGDNAIIGAGCVIHKDIPENTITINQQNQQQISI